MRASFSSIGDDLDSWSRRYLAAAETATTTGVRAATEGFKGDLRGQIAAAMKGSRAPNMIGSKVFPSSGASLGAVGSVFARGKPGGQAETIIKAHAEGATIRGRDGQYLAIPTEAVPRTMAGRRGNTKRMAPVGVEAAFNQELRPVPLANGNVLLVLDNVVRGRRGGVRQATAGRLRQGRQVETIVMFILVKQVRLRKSLTPDQLHILWTARIPALIERAMPEV